MLVVRARTGTLPERAPAGRSRALCYHARGAAQLARTRWELAASVSSEPALGLLLSEREKLLLLLSLALCMFLSSLDGSIVSTALPRILSDLGGFQLLSWVFTLYLLTSTVAVPIVGKLSDMFGRRPFVIAGVVIFLAGSLACGVAPTMLTLIIARGIQGIGGGIILACVLVVMADMYTPIERAKYVGYILAIITAGTLVGPAVGGILTDGPGWRWCFFINLPIGAVALVFIWMTLPNVRRGGAIGDIDFAGAVLLTGATVAALLATAWAYEAYGWTSTITIALLASAGALTALFVAQELRHPQAIIPMLLFRNRMYVLTGLIALLSSAVLFSAVQYLPTFIQTSLGASATASGIIFTPQSLGMLAMSIVGGRMIARTGRFKRQVVLGSALSALAAFLLQTLDVGGAQWHVAVYMVVFGLGSGLVTPVINVIVQASVAQELTGVATSSQMYFRQIAQVLGVALFGVIFTSSYSSSFAGNLDAEARAAMPVAVYEAFEDDATLGIDPERMDAIRAEFLAAGGSTALFERALGTQREAVAVANQRLFLLSAIGGVILVVLALALTEISLRGRASPPAEERPSPAAASP